MRVAALACLSIWACGHERASVISGKVTRPEAGTQIAAQGAGGTLTCPSASPQDLGSVDNEGLLRAQHAGGIPLEFTVTIALHGYQPFTVRIVDVCTAVVDKTCANADIKAILVAAQSKAGK